MHADGHEYIGTWRADDMHADGGMYIGTWCEEAGAVHADGVYYPPSGGPTVPVPREPCDPIMALLQELEVCEGMSHGAAHVQPQRRPR